MNTIAYRFQALLLAVALLLPVVGSATRVDHLFQAEVTVNDRGSAARDAALRRALHEVLVRVTGSQDSVSGQSGQALLRKPQQFVEQFRYREASEEDEPPILWVQFDGVALEREVRSRGLPFWGRERPDTLVWLAVDDRGRRYLVSEHSSDPEVQALRLAAQARGLPVILPLMDLLDQSAVNFADVWGGFENTILAASERYHPQVILTGRLARSSAAGDWRGEWELLKTGTGGQWTSHARDLGTLLAQGLAATGEELAMRYALHGSGSSTRTMLVEGIHDLNAYAQVQTYLKSLTPVDDLQILRVADGSIEFSLRLNADERSLQQLLALGRRLEVVDDPSLWRFRYRP